MKPFTPLTKHLSRRALLRGAGGAAIALPLLEAMTIGRARAATGPSRFVVFFTPGGTVLDAWRPTGTETAFSFGTILAPLEALKARVTVVDGLDLKVTAEGHGHPHSRGMGAILTGQPLLAGPYETCGGKAGFAAGPSLDQVLGEKLREGRKLKSLELGINWPTDRRDGGKTAPTNCINYAGMNQAVPLATDPRVAWERLFQGVGATDAAAMMAQQRSRSILDAVLAEYRGLAPRLGAADRQKLEEHLDRLRDIEVSLDAKAGAMVCVKPEQPAPLADASGAQKGAPGSNSQSNTIKDGAMPQVGKTMVDLLVAGLACDLVRVGTVQYADSQAYNTFPWLGLNLNHHGYQHDHGYQPEAIKKIARWYTEQFLYLLERLAATRDGDGTLLDSTTVLWVTEIQHPNSHAQNNVPFVIAGGRAVKTGRYLRYKGLPHNNLLLTIARAFGHDVESFGRARYCTGTLAGLV